MVPQPITTKWLSGLLKQEITELELRAKEFVTDKEKNILTIYRVDFKAKIKTPEGVKNVIIEIQKAKFHTDIIRFRKYLGEQFSDKNNDLIDGWANISIQGCH